MNSDAKEQYFYIRSKRCKVVASDQCITIQSELTPNLQTVINLSDLIAIRLCTCRKVPTKLVCKCIQAKVDQEQKEFLNATLTKNIINGNFEKPISFVQPDGAFELNGQFQLRRVNSTLSSSAESNDDLDEFINEDENNNQENGNVDNCVREAGCAKSSCPVNEALDVCMNEDEDVSASDSNDDIEDHKNTQENLPKEKIDQEHVTSLPIKVSSKGIDDEKDDDQKVTRIPTSKNLNNKINMSLESDELNCSFEDEEECLMIYNKENNSDHHIPEQSMPTNKRRVSILKDYTQSTLMASTSSGISTSSLNSSTLNKSSKESSQPLISCVRMYYSVPYASFNYKIKYINLIPEYMQEHIVITPETIYTSNNEPQIKYTIKNASSINGGYDVLAASSPSKSALNGKFESINDSSNTLNSLATDTEQQRINMISLVNATSQNRILEQKKTKQFVACVNDHLQEFSRPRSLLLFVNPIGGKKRGPTIFKKICEPLLSLASIKVHTIFTQKANHAYQLLRDENVDLSYYDALGCVGGDGMYSELLNGMLKRNRSASNSCNNYSTPIPTGSQLNELATNDEDDDSGSISVARCQKEKRKHTHSSTKKTSSQRKGKKQQQQAQSESSECYNDEPMRIGERSSSGQSNRTTSKSDITNKQRNAVHKLAQMTSERRLNDRSKLGARHSLPNDSSSSIDPNELSKLNSKRNLPLLIVPSGSTDAVAYSTNGINDPQTVMINFLLGKQINVDVAAVHAVDEENRLLKYCSSFLGYGYFGDVLKDSEENLRWMGPKRYDWAGLKKFFSHKMYKGELQLKVSLLDGDPKDSNLCLSNCQLCAKSYIRNLFNQTEANGLRKSSIPQSVKITKLNSQLDDINNNVKDDEEDEEDNLVIKNINNKNTVYLKGKDKLLNDDENTSVICIKGRFLAINAATLTCRCGHSKYGISPSNHIGNGCCDLIIVIAQCTRKDFLKYLIRTGFSEKSAFDLDFVNVYRVKEFTFKPIVNSNHVSVSSWNCDGEILSEAAINVKVHCQMVSVFGNGVEIRASNKTFAKREKIPGTFKLKCKNSGSIMQGNESAEKKSVKRYKQESSLKSSSTANEERRPSKVEFKAALVY